ncbi:hypothetical protein ABFS82_05G008600 [Erythranthe guttata]
MDRISELPRGILQQILNFLSQKEAVRTSVLSKSWRYNWCIRTNLDLSYNNFRGDKLEFLTVVDNILRRQCDERLSLSEFHLSISLGDPDLISGFYLKKWVPLLTAIGLKKFRLFVDSNPTGVLKPPLKLPPAVFGAESLQDLHLQHFVLHRETIGRILPCKHLTSLCLKHVYIEDEILQKIILGCPLLETLNIKGDCRRVGEVNLNHLHNLKYLSLQLCDVPESDDDELCSFEIHPPSLETIELCYSVISYHEGADFRNLTSLIMSKVGPSSWDHLSSAIFPCLKRLIILNCFGMEEIELFINAPNILYFKYDGLDVPSISFAATSNEWKSEIYLAYDGSSWFKLNELLNSLSHSEMSLAVDAYCTINGEAVVRENVYNRPIVESLRMSSDLVNFMFFICRPKNIYEFKIESMRFLWKILMERESGNGDDELTQLLFRDLEEVSFEQRVDDNREEWCPSTLLDFIRNRRLFQFRFALKWRNTPL